MTLSTSTLRQPRRQAPKLRERQALDFVAHGKTARIDQVAQVLAPGYVPALDDEPRRRLRKGEDKPPPKDKGGKHEWPLGRHQRIAATLPLVNDWVSWALADKYHALDDMPDWVMPTEAGLRWLGLPYTPIEFPSGDLPHLYLINEIRLFLMRSSKIPAYAWTSERELEMHEPRKTRNLELPHRPDGILTIETGGELVISTELTVHLEAGERIAAEAERSRKEFDDLDEILPDLLRTYDRAWYFCGAGAYDAVSKTRAKLPPAEQQRIQIFRLLPSWWEWKAKEKAR
jgi:hypothetical protein